MKIPFFKGIGFRVWLDRRPPSLLDGRISVESSPRGVCWRSVLSRIVKNCQFTIEQIHKMSSESKATVSGQDSSASVASIASAKSGRKQIRRRGRLEKCLAFVVDHVSSVQRKWKGKRVGTKRPSFWVNFGGYCQLCLTGAYLCEKPKKSLKNHFVILHLEQRFCLSSLRFGLNGQEQFHGQIWQFHGQIWVPVFVTKMSFFV